MYVCMHYSQHFVIIVWEYILLRFENKFYFLQIKHFHKIVHKKMCFPFKYKQKMKKKIMKKKKSVAAAAAAQIWRKITI